MLNSSESCLKNKMTTKLSSIVLVAFSTLLTSSAQLFYKKGAAKLPIIFTNTDLIIGMILYIIAAAILIYSLKNGELNVLYPIIATSFIWVTIISYYSLGESLSMYKFIGVLSIIIGITFIGIGSKKTGEQWQQNFGR